MGANLSIRRLRAGQRTGARARTAFGTKSPMEPHPPLAAFLSRPTPLAIAIACAALLLPGQTPAESSLKSGGRTATTGASARLDFRIVIPPVLGLTVVNRSASEDNVEIFSNSRHVMLNATLPGEATSAAIAGAGRASDASRHLLFRAPRSGILLANCACHLAEPRVVSQRIHAAEVPILDTRPVLCTVAMPSVGGPRGCCGRSCQSRSSQSRRRAWRVFAYPFSGRDGVV